MNGNPLRRMNLQEFGRAVVLLALSAGSAPFSVVKADDRVELGRELFEHKWVANDPLSPGGDGLGPMHNADSCVACHHLGGNGGAGDTEHNVDLLSLAVGSDAASNPKLLPGLQKKAGQAHPAFAPVGGSAATIVFHRFGTDPRYERLRLAVLGFKLPADAKSERVAIARRHAVEKLSTEPPVADLSRNGGPPLRLSHRNTPALFGAGLINSISDKTLLDLEKQEAELSPETAGHVARTSDGKVGRFGWRGQVATLREFVVSACAIELGLQNPGHPQALNPLDPRRSSRAGDDLTRDQCDALVAYVAALPAPVRREPARQKDAEHVSRGEKLFDSCGCSTCHVRDVGHVQGIYTDLLLHDLGSVLEEPLLPSGGAYYGARTIDILAQNQSPSRREWKTPPLWGLRDSAPYLHDGRARTLTEAITAHGGQAEASVNRFRNLDYLARTYLQDFLNSLGCPPEETAAVADAH